MPRIADNLARVRDSIAVAAERSGRTADSITLVAVTKLASVAESRQLVLAGCTNLGEGRPQELWNKHVALSDLPIRWHLVGHLQRNKVERTLPLVSLIHSVDSLRLLQAINAGAENLGRVVPVLLEVNISGDAAKHGFSPEEMSVRFAEAIGFKHVEMRGLMGMASLEGDMATARREFQRLRQLRDQLAPLPGGERLKELSMGMSGDFEVAIEEGATIVRIGSALFEES